MNLWCTDCESFTEFDPIEDCCMVCGVKLGSPNQLKRPCTICKDEACEPEIDVCTYCDEELVLMYDQKEFQTTFPGMCCECRVRVCDIDTGICDQCYGILVWGAPAKKTPVPKSRAYEYDWWGDEVEADAPIPAAAEELQTIPAMRSAA